MLKIIDTPTSNTATPLTIAGVCFIVILIGVFTYLVINRIIDKKILSSSKKFAEPPQKRKQDYTLTILFPFQRAENLK